MDASDWVAILFICGVVVALTGVIAAGYAGSLREDTLRGECVARGRTWYSGNCAPVGFTLPLR